MRNSTHFVTSLKLTEGNDKLVDVKIWTDPLLTVILISFFEGAAIRKTFPFLIARLDNLTGDAYVWKPSQIALFIAM